MQCVTSVTENVWNYPNVHFSLCCIVAHFACISVHLELDCASSTRAVCVYKDDICLVLLFWTSFRGALTDLNDSALPMPPRNLKYHHQ